jgi:hypothetical protein
VTDQNRVIELESVQHGEHVIAETVGRAIRVCRSSLTGSAKATPCNPVDVIFLDKLGRKLIEGMGCVT